jgi:outer membrane lipoprotein SlyB
MNPKLIAGAVAALLATAVWAQNIDIEYGVVSDIVTNKTSGDSSGTKTGAAAGGALGGLLGATSSKANSSGEKRRRSLFYGAAGALAGGAIGSTTDNKSVTIYTYTVALLDGESFDITTEQGHIDAGDCVSIERGSSVNIRRVAQVFCDVPGDTVYSEHVVEAEECSMAKQELVAAQGGEAIDAAIRKIKILCDD